MSSSPLCYVATSVEESLRNSVPANIDRYTKTGFDDLAESDGWALRLTISADLAPLKQLKTESGTDAEVFNSLLVWQSLGHLTPSLASEGRIWTRLCHVECLEYARARWVAGRKGASAIAAVETHFFGSTRTMRRDDNAIGRLWWNAYIAKQALPSQHFEALKALLKTADIRLSVVERPYSTSRARLAGGILRTIIRTPGVTSSEAAFRSFMKTVNARGGGVMFELMDEPEIDCFLAECIPA